MQMTPPPHFELTIRHRRSPEGDHYFSVVERDEYLAYCRQVRCAPFRVVIDSDMASDIGGVAGNDLLLDSVVHALFPHGDVVTARWEQRP
jgi:hypothetical protein